MKRFSRREWLKAGHYCAEMDRRQPNYCELHIDPANGKLDALSAADLSMLAYFVAAGAPEPHPPAAAGADGR